MHYRKSLECRVPRSLPCAFYRAHGKEPLCGSLPGASTKTHGKKIHTTKSMLCRVLTHGKHFAVCFFLHTAESIVCRVLFSAHGKVIIFFSSHLETFSTHYIQHVVPKLKLGTFLIFFAIYN